MTTILKKALSVLMAFLVFVGGIFVSFNIDNIAAENNDYDAVYDYTDTTKFGHDAISESNLAIYGMCAAGPGLYAWEDSVQNRWKGINPAQTKINEYAWGTFETYVIYKVKPGSKFEATLYLASNSGNSWCKQNIATAAGAPFEFKIESSNAVDGTWGNAWDTSAETAKDITAVYDVPADCNYVKITFPQKGKVEHVMPNDVTIQGNDLGRLYGVRFTKDEPIQYDSVYDYTALDAMGVVGNEATLGINAVSKDNVAGLSITKSKGVEPSYSTLKNNAWGTLNNPYVIYEVKPGSKFEATFQLNSGAAGNWAAWSKQTIAHLTGEPFEFKIEASGDGVTWKNAWDTSAATSVDIVKEYNVPEDCNYVRITFPQKGNVNAYCSECGAWHLRDEAGFNQYGLAANDFARLKGVRYFKAPEKTYANEYDYSYVDGAPINVIISDSNLAAHGMYAVSGSQTASLVKNAGKTDNPGRDGIELDYNKLDTNAWGTLDNPYVIYEVTPGTYFEATLFVRTKNNAYCKEAIAEVTGVPFEMKMEVSNSATDGWKNAIDTSSFSTDQGTITMLVPNDCNYVKITYPQTGYVENVKGVAKIQANDLARIMKVRFTKAPEKTYDTTYDYTTFEAAGNLGDGSNYGIHSMSSTGAAGLLIEAKEKGINPSYGTLNSNAYGTLSNPYVIYKVKPGTWFEATLFLASNTGNIYCKERIAEVTKEPFEFVIEASSSASMGWKNAKDTSGITGNGNNAFTFEYYVPTDCEYVKITFPQKGYVTVDGTKMATQDRAKLMGVKYNAPSTTPDPNPNPNPNPNPEPTFNAVYDYTTALVPGATQLTSSHASAIGALGITSGFIYDEKNTGLGIGVGNVSLKNVPWGTKSFEIVYEVTPGTTFAAQFRLPTNKGDIGTWKAWSKETFAHLAGEPWEFKISSSSSATSGWGNEVTSADQTTNDFTINYSVPDDCSYVKITFPQKGCVDPYCASCGKYHLRTTQEDAERYGLQGDDLARLLKVSYTGAENHFADCGKVMDYEANGPVDFFYDNDDYLIYLYQKNGIAIDEFANGATFVAPDKDYVKGTGFSKPYVTYAVKPNTKFVASVVANREAAANLGADFKVKVYESADGANWTENITAPIAVANTDFFKFTTAATTKFVKVEFPHTDAVKDVDGVNEIFGLAKVGLTPDETAYVIENPYGNYNFVDTSKFYNDPRYVSFNPSEFGVHEVTGPGGLGFEGTNDKPGYYLAYTYGALLNRENAEKNGLVYAVKPGTAFQVVALVSRNTGYIQTIEKALGTHWDIMLEVSYDGENWTPYNNPSRILTDKHLAEGTNSLYKTEVITIPALPADANFVRVLYPHTGNMNKATNGAFQFVGNDLIGVAQVNYTYAKASLPPKYNAMYDYSDTSIGTAFTVEGTKLADLGISNIGGLGLMYIEAANRPGICVGYGSLTHDWGTKEKGYVIYEVNPGTVFEAQFYLASGGGARGWNKETIAQVKGEPFEFVIEASDSETSGWKNAVDTSSATGSNVTIKYQVPADCTYVKITFPQNGKFTYDMNGDGKEEEVRGNDLARLLSVGFNAPENQFAGCDTVFDYKANGPVDFFYDNDAFLIYIYEKNGIAVEKFSSGSTFVAPDKDYVKGTGFSKPYVTFAVKPNTQFVAGINVDREAAAARGDSFKVRVYESKDGVNWTENATAPLAVAKTDYYKFVTAVGTKFVKIEFPHTDAVKGVDKVNEIFGLAKVGLTPNDAAYVIKNPYGDYKFEATYDFYGEVRPSIFNADEVGVFEIGVPGALGFEGDPAKPGYYLAYTYGNLVGKPSVEKASLVYSVKPGTAFQVVSIVSRDDGFIQKIEEKLGTNWDIMLEVSSDGKTWSSYKPMRILTEDHLLDSTPARYKTEVITIPTVPANVKFVKIVYPQTGDMSLVTEGAFPYTGNDLIGIAQVSYTDGGAVPASKYVPDKSLYNSVMDAAEGSPDESLAYVTGLQYAEGMQVMAPSWTYLNGTGGAVMANAGIYAIVKEGSAFYAEAAFRASLHLAELDEKGELVKNKDGNPIIVKTVDPFKYSEGYGARLYFSSDRMTWNDVTDQYLQVINGSGALPVLHRFDIPALPAGVKYVKVELPINRNMIGCPFGNEGLATAYTGNDFCGIRRVYFNADEHVEYKSEINYGNYFTEDYGSGFPTNITGENNKVLGLYSYTPGAFEIKDFTSSSTPDGRITIKESYLFNKEEVDAPYLVYNVEENSPFYMGVNVSGTGRLSAMPDGRLRLYVSETGQDGSWTEFTDYTYVENQAHTFSRYYADNLGAKTKFLMIVFPITGDLSLNPENNAKGSSGANFFQIRDIFTNVVDFDPSWNNKKEYVFIHPNGEQQVIIPGAVIVTPVNWLLIGIIAGAGVLLAAAAAVVIILIIKKKKKNAPKV